MPPEVPDSLLGDVMRWAGQKPARWCIVVLIICAVSLITVTITG